MNFVLLSLVAACSRHGGETNVLPSAAAAPAAPVVAAAAGPFAPDAYAFNAIGSPTTTVAPIYITLSLNINDFLHPTEEAASVRRFLDTTSRLGLNKVELSFTGEVLDALKTADPTLLALIKARRPTINEHPRFLHFRHLEDTAHDLFRTDTGTLELDRHRPGALVHIQQVFGVTPRDNGGILAAALRTKWVEGPSSAALRAVGFERVARGEVFTMPSRYVGAGLAPPGAVTPGNEVVDAWVDLYRRIAKVRSGELPTEADAAARFEDLGRWVNLAKLQGIDLAKLPTVTGLVDPAPMGRLQSRPDAWLPADADRQRFAALPPADQVARLRAAYLALCAATCTLLDPAAEITARLDSLDPHQTWSGRIAWHASDETTIESWSKNLYGGKRWSAARLQPVALRPAAEQARIVVMHEAFLSAIAKHPRVKLVSIDHDTQWAPESAPERGWREVFGRELSRFPDGFDADALEAAAVAMGVVSTDASQEGRSKPTKGGKAGKGKVGKAGGGRGDQEE